MQALQSTDTAADNVTTIGKKEKSILELVREDPARLRTIKQAAETIIKLESQRKAINSQITAERDKVVEAGISRAAFKRALSRMKLTETERESQELEYQICTVALGVEHQTDLLDTLDRQEIQGYLQLNN